jgi:hypothetical protein
MLAMTLPLIVGCKGDDNDINSDRVCITNKTSYDWHNAGVQFQNVEGKKVKYVNIGAVEKNGYRYVPIAASYFVVDFVDNNGVKHESEKYYSNPYVDVSFLSE